MRKIITLQLIVLLVGTLFAWGNFVLEVVNWHSQQICSSCSGRTCPEIACPALSTLFTTPCFYGAMFFTMAFILSVILFRHKN